MARALLPEDLWSIRETRLQIHDRSPKRRRLRIDDRAVMTGILFALKTGIPWAYLPRELGCGRGMTFWRCHHEWVQAGVWQRVHEAFSDGYESTTRSCGIDLALMLRAYRHLPEASARAEIQPIAALRSKHHLPVDERGLPLVAQISAARVHDSRFLIPLVESIPTVKAWREEPANVQVSLMIERTLRKHIGIGCAGEASQLLSSLRRRVACEAGPVAWVVERTLGWLHRFRRLRIGHERRGDMHQSFLSLACSLICWRYVERFCWAFLVSAALSHE